jgi:hypothetical protein
MITFCNPILAQNLRQTILAMLFDGDKPVDSFWGHAKCGRTPLSRRARLQDYHIATRRVAALPNLFVADGGPAGANRRVGLASTSSTRASTSSRTISTILDVTSSSKRNDGTGQLLHCCISKSRAICAPADCAGMI